MNTVRIGTRGSELALWQAHFTQSLLEKLGVKSELVIIKTQGDRIQDLSFDKMEGKGFFTKEIEAALLANEIDLAVHSFKDLESRMPEGLALAAIPQRSFPNDMLLIRKEAYRAELPLGVAADAIIGTSSARRKAQLRHHLPQCTTRDLRGNVPTRIQKLRDGNYDAIVLAKAGVARLELSLVELEARTLDPTSFVPAPAQGALALQTRADDALIDLLEPLNITDADTVQVERLLLAAMEGGCQMPFGAWCERRSTGYRLHAAFATHAEAPVTYAMFEGDDGAALARRMRDHLKSTA
jgi:hydroxymethylbilane synthase